MPSPAVIIGAIVCCCLVILAIVLGVYYSSTSDSPAPSPVDLGSLQTTSTPRQTLLASGQAIQVAENTISVATPPTITTQPTGITATGSFTLSTDINMTTLPAAGLLRVIGQGVHPGNPGLWLFPAGADGTTWLRMHVGNSALDLVTGTAPPVYNTYYNITAVYDAPTHTATLYYNGVSKSSSTSIVPAGYVPPTPTNFIWNQQNMTSPTIKVKNTYWFNKALTAAEVSTLAGTTSTYMPQPFAMAVSNTAGTTSTYMPQPFAMAVSNVAGTTSTYTSESTCESIEGYSMY